MVLFGCFPEFSHNDIQWAFQDRHTYMLSLYPQMIFIPPATHGSVSISTAKTSMAITTMSFLFVGFYETAERHHHYTLPL